MSVTISAAPVLLIGSLVSIVSAAIQGAQGVGLNDIHMEEHEIQRLFNQEFQTQIMDEQVLLKTLKEHGVVNIEQHMGNIACDSDRFHLEFTRHENAPYTLRITANNKYGIEELANDIGTEYTANAQEISYNKIKERLEAKNMVIEDEEIYDDNTIVLTVNLD